MKYVIFHKETGAIEENCHICSIQTVAGVKVDGEMTYPDFENDPIPPDHDKRLLTPEEELKIAEVNLFIGRYKNKVDVKDEGRKITEMSADEIVKAREKRK